MKPVYGMAQAGRRWQRSLFPWLTDPGSKGGGLAQCESDPSVFFRRKNNKTPNGVRFEILIVGVYVDDLFILYSHSDDLSLYVPLRTFVWTLVDCSRASINSEVGPKNHVKCWMLSL